MIAKPINTLFSTGSISAASYFDSEDGSFIFGMIEKLAELLSKFIIQNLAYCLVKDFWGIVIIHDFLNLNWAVWQTKPFHGNWFTLVLVLGGAREVRWTIFFSISTSFTRKSSALVTDRVSTSNNEDQMPITCISGYYGSPLSEDWHKQQYQRRFPWQRLWVLDQNGFFCWDYWTNRQNPKHAFCPCLRWSFLKVSFPCCLIFARRKPLEIK